MECEKKPILHIEVLKNNKSVQDSRKILEEVNKMLQEMKVLSVETTLKDCTKTSLKDHVHRIRICELDSPGDIKHVDMNMVEAMYHLFRLETCGPSTEELDEDELDIPAATHWVLPSSEFDEIWENLIYDTPIKEQLLKFVQTTMLFSDKGLNKNIISWNKVVLLHGPPGTGKTSLCRALAQKLSIRLSSRYSYTQLVEINTHSLFSKWFSESGKLVQKMFTKITELAEDRHSLVVVLIDEVESLTRSRESAASGSDPSDAIRVVNAVLTQLDQINKFPNVLIVTTSNISGTVDLAFVDRADIKQYIGYPSRAAIYQIYHSCISEMKRTGIIMDSETVFTLRELETTNMIVNDATKSSHLLWDIAGHSVGFSGRTLRKIPFLAHAFFSQTLMLSLPTFLSYLQLAVDKQKQDRTDIGLGGKV
ncbi:hypothetical protein Pmani_033458 [Petrolisthes manimaculis]|uniref:Pachytene checkpoint protein 2 homolog n=1 Tax=Petrolisthes manimaculis TaxID=1843537 RepID=A0AAE1NQF4_9EUCA|nr:hypothetical protein Pmani_033458 [Petrolisthes manimaculis]